VSESRTASVGERLKADLHEWTWTAEEREIVCGVLEIVASLKSLLL